MNGELLKNAFSRLLSIVFVALACFLSNYVHAQMNPAQNEAFAQATGVIDRENETESKANQEASESEQSITQAQDEAVERLTTVLTTLSAAIDQKIGMFSSKGNLLVGALALLAFAWLGLRTMLQGSSFAEAISEAVMLFLTVGMVSWAVNADALGRGVQAGFDMITAEILSSAGYGGADDGVITALKIFLGTILEMYGQPTGAEFLSPTSWVPALGVVITKLFMALFLLVATLAYLAMYIMTQVMFGIGLVLGPLLIPFYIVPPLSFLATGWFKFLISAGLAKVSGALILSLTLGMVNGLTELVRNTGVENGVPFGLYSITFLIIGIMAVMMMQAWSIGSSILTGVSRMNSGLPNKLQPAGMATAASGTLKSAAGAAATGAGAATGAVAGAFGGAASYARGNNGGSGSLLQSVTSGAASGAVKGAQVASHPIQALRNTMSGTSKPSSGGSGSGGSGSSGSGSSGSGSSGSGSGGSGSGGSGSGSSGSGSSGSGGSQTGQGPVHSGGGSASHAGGSQSSGSQAQAQTQSGDQHGRGSTGNNGSTAGGAGTRPQSSGASQNNGSAAGTPTSKNAAQSTAGSTAGQVANRPTATESSVQNQAPANNNSTRSAARTAANKTAGQVAYRPTAPQIGGQNQAPYAYSARNNTQRTSASQRQDGSAAKRAKGSAARTLAPSSSPKSIAYRPEPKQTRKTQGVYTRDTRRGQSNNKAPGENKKG